MIEFTGERVIPGKVDPNLWAEHLSRYAFASRFARQALVLDMGCGAGYGTVELAGHSRFAIGIDSASEAVAYAKSAYTLPNVSFVSASATALPFRDASFALITAFEVIEHLPDWRALLSEARRVLHPDGVFLVSTPNLNYYTESRGSSGPNPFHIHEFTFEEFGDAVAEFFPSRTVLLQNRVEAFAFYRPQGESAVEGRMNSVRGAPEEAHFFLAVCSLREPQSIPGFLFVHQGSNVLREREKHIESLQQELLEAREQFAALHRDHDKLTLYLEEQNRWALRTGEELGAARQNHAAAEATVIERTLWAQRLGAEVQDLESRLNLWRASRWTKLGRKLNLGPDLDQSLGKGDASGGGS